MREGKGCGGISFSAITTALNPTNADIIVSWDGIDIFPLSRNHQGQRAGRVEFATEFKELKEIAQKTKINS